MKLFYIFSISVILGLSIISINTTSELSSEDISSTVLMGSESPN